MSSGLSSTDSSCSSATDTHLLYREARSLKDKIRRARIAACDTIMRKYTETTSVVNNTLWQPRRKMEGHLSRVCALRWGPDSRQILTAGQDSSLMLWDSYLGYKFIRIPMDNPWVMGCAYAPSGNLVAYCGLDQACNVLKVQKKYVHAEKHRQLVGHEGYVSGCDFLSDDRMVTCSGDYTCALWDLTTGSMLFQFQGHSGPVMGLAKSPDGKFVLTASCDATVKLWDVRLKSCLQTFAGHRGDINAVEFFPSYTAFATASEDGTCKMFDIRADQEIATYHDQSVDVGVTSVAFSKSGRLLLAGFDDYKVRVWDALKTDLVGTHCHQDGRISSMGVSMDGKALASGSWDGSVVIWN